jgi:hypothetical protein
MISSTAGLTIWAIKSVKRQACLVEKSFSSLVPSFALIHITTRNRCRCLPGMSNFENLPSSSVMPSKTANGFIFLPAKNHVFVVVGQYPLYVLARFGCVFAGDVGQFGNDGGVVVGAVCEFLGFE